MDDGGHRLAQGGGVDDEDDGCGEQAGDVGGRRRRAVRGAVEEAMTPSTTRMSAARCRPAGQRSDGVGR
jgi:hypothetical protein